MDKHCEHGIKMRRNRNATPRMPHVILQLFTIKNTDFFLKSRCFGGDKRDRTADLLNAIQALSQLSYTPVFSSPVRGERIGHFVGVLYFAYFIKIEKSRPP